MAGRVLITGATGAVGPSIVQAFLKEDFSVRTFSIDPPERGMFPDVVENRIGDITSRSDIDSAAKEVDCVVHMAALLHKEHLPRSLDPKYDLINVQGTSNIIRACLKENVRRLVFFSTSAVYGPGQGQIFSEDDLQHPDTEYARTKLAAEGLVLGAKVSSGQALGTVLRMSAVYGTRVKGNYRRLVRGLARRRFLAVGKGENRRTLIYDHDAASAAVLAAVHSAAAGRIFNVTDGRIYSLAEILRTLAQLLGRRPPRILVPSGVALIAAGAIELGGKMTGRLLPLSRKTITRYLEDLPVSSKRISSELGFVPQFDMIRGWSEVIDEMRRTGEI